jgi:hypothetical protein
MEFKALVTPFFIMNRHAFRFAVTGCLDPLIL